MPAADGAGKVGILLELRVASGVAFPPLFS